MSEPDTQTGSHPCPNCKKPLEEGIRFCPHCGVPQTDTSATKADSAPTLIIHGDKDFLVPIQQAEAIMASFKDAGVAAELVVRKGRAHDFNGADKDFPVIVDWFDKHLKKKS